VLNGTWKLLFTDAADATFRRGKRFLALGMVILQMV
jgi:hypothetical protein